MNNKYTITTFSVKHGISAHVLVWNLDIIREVLGTLCDPDNLTRYEYYGLFDLVFG